VYFSELLYLHIVTGSYIKKTQCNSHLAIFFIPADSEKYKKYDIGIDSKRTEPSIPNFINIRPTVPILKHTDSPMVTTNPVEIHFLHISQRMDTAKSNESQGYS
jgi:hypothetical protein